MMIYVLRWLWGEFSQNMQEFFEGVTWFLLSVTEKAQALDRKLTYFAKDKLPKQEKSKRHYHEYPEDQYIVIEEVDELTPEAWEQIKTFVHTGKK